MKLVLFSLAAAGASASPLLSLSAGQADSRRREIAASVNADPASTWTARYPPVARFHGKDYGKLRQMAGVLEDAAEDARPVKTLEHFVDAKAIPENWNATTAWPQCPIIAEIRDQSACGSCYAVSAASAASDRFCIFHDGAKSDRLSEVDLMSCCKTCAGANGGCFGGNPGKCWDYMVQQGITTGGAYGDFSMCLEYPMPPCEHHISGNKANCSDDPYLAPTCWWSCDGNTTYKLSYDQDQNAHKFKTSYKVEAKVETIQQELMSLGPVQASMYLVDSFEVYAGGIYSTTSEDWIGKHAVRIVGWGTDAGVDYWLVANSWNSEWGEEGYFRIKRGGDNLGIENEIVAGALA